MNDVVGVCYVPNKARMYISPTRAISLYEAFGSMKIWTVLFYVYENIQFISSEKHDVVSHPPNAMAVLYEQWSCYLRKYWLHGASHLRFRKISTNETNKKKSKLIGHSGKQPYF